MGEYSEGRPGDIGLSDFIRSNTDAIVGHSVRFARTLEPLAGVQLDEQALRDHLPLVLEVIALDLEQPQTRAEGITKSEGGAPERAEETAAETHGQQRAKAGLSVGQLVAEYRVLRAVVTRLWTDQEKVLPAEAIPDLIRFNEAIDQAIAESITVHTVEVERWRDTLLAIVGHDLRGPLQAMRMTAEILAVRAAGGPSAPAVDLLQRGAARLGTLLDTLLDYNRARLGSGMVLDRQPVDLGQACRAELDLLRAALPDVEIRWTERGSALGEFDASRVREALSNLVSNAARHRHACTAVEVTLDGTRDDVVLSVANEGEPVDPGELRTFFEPLRRRDPGAGARHHLGIGLFVVREIARAHGGEVTAEASGNTIVFSLRMPKKT